MIHQISKQLANFLLRKNAIPENEIDIYIYGYEMLLSELFDFIIVVSIGIIYDKIATMIVFFIMFITTRIYTGGYHANTFARCKEIFFTICMFMILTTDVHISLGSLFAAILIFNVTVYLLAPVDNINKRLSDDEKIKYRDISILTAWIWSCIAIITYFNFIEISQSIMITALIIAFLMIVGNIKNRMEVKCYESE